MTRRYQILAAFLACMGTLALVLYADALQSAFSVAIPAAIGVYLCLGLATQKEIAMRSVSVSTRVGSETRPLVVAVTFLCLVGSLVRLLWLLQPGP